MYNLTNGVQHFILKHDAMKPVAQCKMNKLRTSRWWYEPWTFKMRTIFSTSSTDRL